MILKIKRELDNQEWWILDSIRKVSIGKTFERNRRDFNELDVDVVIMDRMNSGDENPPGDHPMKVLICRLDSGLESGDEYVIVFDTFAYLCNDLGKTIEKIVV